MLFRHRQISLYFSALLLILAINSHAQDWTIINSDYCYNYRSENSDFTDVSIMVDSIYSKEDDTILYLNRIIRDLPDSSDGWGRYYALFNEPQFLQREVYETDSSVIFQSPMQFEILKSTSIGDDWVFDKQNAYTIEHCKTFFTESFGQEDSVRVLKLSTSDTILISRNYGLLRFDSPYDDINYTLFGIENLVGEQINSIEDFFVFDVGSVFEYKSTHGNPDGWKRRIVERVYIIGKELNGDSIIYRTREHKSYSSTVSDVYDESVTVRNSQFVVVKDDFHPISGYNNQLLNIDGWRDDVDIVAKIQIDKSFQGALTKRIGSCNYNNVTNFYSIISRDSSLILSIRNYEEDLVHRKFAIGYGEVYTDSRPHEGGYSKELTAYKKGGEVVFGTFVDDAVFLLDDIFVEKREMSIFPNPARDIIRLEIPGIQEFKVSIHDLQGILVKELYSCTAINVSDLPQGLYIVEVESSDGKLFTKLLIE